MWIIVSDLHLGAADALEDFLRWSLVAAAGRAAAVASLDASFAAFLDHHLSLADNLGRRPTLVLNGDTFDLWQVRQDSESVAAALGRIVDAHQPVLAAWKRWLAAGGAIEFILGNHDHELLDDRAWARLRGELPGLNRRTCGAPAHFVSDPAAGIYAEHGNRWDPFNRIARLDRPDAGCAGRHIVRHIVNRLEPHLPLVDKGTSTADIIRVANEAAPELLREAWEKLSGAARGARTLLSHLLPWSSGLQADWEAIATREVEAMNRGIRRALTRQGATVGALPRPCAVFASGHTHLPLRAVAGRGMERLNTGTWRPVLAEPGGRSLVQPLSYGRLLTASGRVCEISLRSWEDEEREAAVGRASSPDPPGSPAHH